MKKMEDEMNPTQLKPVTIHLKEGCLNKRSQKLVKEYCPYIEKLIVSPNKSSDSRLSLPGYCLILKPKNSLSVKKLMDLKKLIDCSN